MATNDGERYVRLTLLTFEGGIWVSKLIFLREVDALANKPGLNAFLQSHKPHLKLKKNIHELTTRQYKILFPSGGGDTDIDDWDLQLLIKLTLDLFKTCLNGQETSDLKEILRIRNEVICHASQPAISEQVFSTQWGLLVGCIYSLSAGQIAGARTIIGKYQSGPILQCHLDNLSALCRNDEHMENVHAALGTVQTSLARIERNQNATSDLISSHDSKLNDIVARLQRIESSKNEQECSTAHVNIPRLKTQLRIRGDSDEKVKNVEVFVARALEAVMKNVNDPDDDVRVKDAFAEMLTVIERKGGDATAVEQGSVYLHIQCKSISKLRCILEWFLESNNSHQMLQLEAALNGKYEEQFKVCLVLSEESIVKLLDWTGEHVPCSESTSSGELRAKGQVNFGIKCHSSESVMQVVQYFSSGEAANKLNKLSEALSSLVGGTIKVEANVDLDQFLADLTLESGGKKSASFSSMKLPPLTKQLQNILSSYPGGQIVKELIQNAEDAGATKIELVCDEREFHGERSRGQQEDYSRFFEGPALCVYNDALFTEADWEGIRMIDSSVKEDDRLTVGQFGQGFKSVFHLTDFPCVLSGDKLLLIDPQQERDRVNATMELNLLHEYEGINIDTFFEAFEGNFGITRDLMKRGSFPGTLFRFPLRRSPSELSKQTYDKDKLKELFEIFESEASSVLLFLRNLGSISLHTRSNGNQSVRLAEVKITNIKDVKRKRDDFNKTVGSLPYSYNGTPVICPLVLIIEYTSQQRRMKETKTWIVVNYFMGGNAFQEFRSLIEDSDLQLSPYVGVAAPIDQSEDEFTGHLFCFLPLPREGTKLTGLPVHVNGYFALDQSRHHVKWATEAQRGHKIEEKTIRWNEKLVGEALPLAYKTWFDEAVKYACNQGNDAKIVRNIHQSFPNATEVHLNWSVMLERLFSQLRNQKILYSLNGHWIIVQGAFLINEDTLSKTSYHETVIKAACLLNIDCVIVNKVSASALSSNENICASQFTPKLLANRLRQKNIFSSLSDQERLHILEYLLTDGDTGILENLPLLPLQSGEWTTFLHQSRDQRSRVYMASQQQMSLLPSMEGCFIRHSLPGDVQNQLQHMCRKNKCQLAVLEAKDLENLLNDLIQKTFPGSTRRRLKSSTLSLNWLQEVWQYLIQNKRVSMCTRVPIFPLLEGGKSTNPDVVLICLTDKAIFQEQNNDRLPEDILCCLKALDFDIIASLPPWLPPLHVEQFVQKPSPRAVENVLAHITGNKNTQNKIHSFNSCSDSGRRAFMLYMTDIKDYTSNVRILLRALKMFNERSSYNGRHQMTSVQDNGYFTACKDFPVKYPLPCLDGYQQVEWEMLTRLGCHEVNLQELFKSAFDEIKRSAYYGNDVKNVMMHFVSNYRTLKYTAPQQFHDLVMKAKDIPFLPSLNGLKRPSDLFTPTEQKLQELFDGQEGMFPTFPTMPDEDTICTLQELGLKDESHVTASDLLQAARILEQWSTRNADRTLKKSRSLVDHLRSYPSVLNQICERKDLKTHLESLHIVEYQANRPSSYPSWMPWFTQDRQLCKPNAARNECLMFIVGSVMPTVTVTCEKLNAIFGWKRSPKASLVAHHLLNASKNYSMKGKKDILVVLGHVYEWLCHCGEDLSHLRNEAVVWNGEGFSKPTKIVITEGADDIDLRPFYFFIPDTCQEYADFFRKIDCHTHQGIPLLIDTLSQIEQCSHTPSQRLGHVVLALRVIEKLAQRRNDITDESLANVLIPLRTEDDDSLRFKPVAECTYSSNPDSYIEEDGDLPVYFVHERISEEVASRLDIKSMMGTMLSETEELGVEEWGQHESLTDRIKNLLEGYRDGLSIPKELLQNADDAGATTIEFLYDERQNTDARRSLLHAGMKVCQGPALWVYNNAMFSEADFQNIIKLNAATKRDDSTTIGKFGLGFCSVYNLTDVPSFVSGNNIVILDPQRTHLVEALPGNTPGMKIDVRRPRNKALIKKHKDQFKPYKDVFGCDIFKRNFHFNGTLFRFPLRTYEESLSSEMCSVQYSKKEMTKLLQMFYETAGNLLLFIQNVKTIKVYHLSENASSPEEKRLMFSVSRDCTEWQNDSFSHTFYARTNMLSKVLNNIAAFKQLQQVTIELLSFADTGDKLLKSASQLHSLSVTWLVSWATGTNESARLAAFYQDKKRALPLSAVAVPVEADMMTPKALEHPTVSQGFYQTGHVFCFLPMPIEINLDFHLHGCFEISSDRRQLSILTEDDKGTRNTSWNNCLLEDATVNALMHLLHFLSHHASKDYMFHQLWPIGRMTIEDPFKQSFYRELVKTGEFFKGVSGWASFGNIVYLDRSIRECGEIGEIANDMATKYFKDSKKTYVNLPTSIQLELENSNREKVDYIRQNAITEIVLIDVLLDTLNGKIWDENTVCRDKMLVFMLETDNKIILQKLEKSECIPCEELGTLRCPRDLVHPKCEMSSLFLSSDGRFPAEIFRSQNCLKTLVKLGMMKDYLREEVLLERCKSIAAISNKCCSCALTRIRALFQYLGHTKVQKKLKDEDTAIHEIRGKIKFLPVLRHPEKWPFSWFADESDSVMHFHSGICNYCCSDKENELTLSTPDEMFRQNVMNYIGTVELILDENMLFQYPPMYFRETLIFLKVRGVVELPCVFKKIIEQLCIITNEYVMEENALDIVKDTLGQIYDRLQYIVSSCQDTDEKRKYEENLKMLIDRKVILIGKYLFNPSHVAFNVSVECFPHINKLPDTEKTSRNKIYRLIGVRETFCANHVIAVLAELKQKWAGQKCVEIDVVVKLLHNLYDIMASNSETYEQYADAKESIVAPDVNCILRPTFRLVVDDTSYVAIPNMYILHDNVPVAHAMAFGVKPKRKGIANIISKGIPFGQKEDLVIRLKGLLKSYPRDESVLKELLQNADDAGATELHFIKDYRTHCAEGILINENFQGPALCVYNNSYFSEKDLEGIHNLGYGSKRLDLTKTGQYGVGFNAVYHLTDTPSFISKGPSLENGGVLCIFDPTCSNIEDVDKNEPGMRYYINDVRQDFPCELLGFSEEDVLQTDTGTMFRFPLRKKETDLSNDVVGPEDVNKMLSVFMEDMKEVLLFLKNIKCIKISDISSGKIKTDYTVWCSLTDDDSKKKGKFINDVNRWAHETMNSKTHCSTIQSEVQYVEKICDSKSFKKTWLIVQKLGASSYPETVMNGIMNKTLIHLPVGGVALPLTDYKEMARHVEEIEKMKRENDTTAQPIKVPRPFKGRAFAVLPLPVQTGLPAHVNGHFSLDHESRRGLWKEGVRLQWNQFIRKYVIVHCLANAISFFKRYFDQTHKNFVVMKMWKQMDDLMERYHNMFPVNDSATEAFWKEMIGDFYQFVQENELSLFPVVDKNAKIHVVTQWVPLQSGASKYSAVFNTLSKTLHTRERRTIETVLKTLGMKLVQTPKRVFETMRKSADIKILVSDPDFVITFLHSFREDKAGTCVIGGLNGGISNTAFMNPSNLRDTVAYIAGDKDFCAKIIGLPIMLTSDGKLRECSAESPAYHSEYANILPHSASLFLHDILLPILLDKQLYKIGVLKVLDVATFLNLLPQSVPALHTWNVVLWNKANGSPVSKAWLLRMYQFLYVQCLERTVNSIEFCNQTKFCSYFDQFGAQAIIPVTRREDDMDVYELIPACKACSVFYSSGYETINELIETLNIPMLDDSVFCKGDKQEKDNGMIHAISKCITTTGDAIKVLQCLLAHREHMTRCTITHDNALELLSYFERNIQVSKKKKNTHLLTDLKMLPLYVTKHGSLVNITDWREVVVLTGEIPDVGIEYWTSDTNIVILCYSDKVDKLYTQLKVTKHSPQELYGNYILKKYQSFSHEQLLVHIEFIRDHLLHPDPKGKLSGIQELIVGHLKQISFIRVEGHMKRASELYDDAEPLFQYMLDDSMFPPETFRSVEWKPLLSQLGLKSEADEEQLLEFALSIQAEGNSGISETVLKKSELVLKRFKELCDSDSISDNFLQKLKTVQFIPQNNVQRNRVKLAGQFEEGNHLIAFKNSVIPLDEILCWTSMNILPWMALPTTLDTVLPKLDVNMSPPVERVISHCQNISEPLATYVKSRNIDRHFVFGLLEKLYDFLMSNVESNEHLMKTRLEFTRLIYVTRDDNLVQSSSVVIELSQDYEIKPYLYKAPTEFGKYNKLFVAIGAQEKVTCNHYISVLTQLKRIVKDTELDVQELHDAACAIKELLYMVTPKNAKKIHFTDLFLPNEAKILVNARDLIVCDSDYIYDRIQNARADISLNLFIGFQKLDVHFFNPKQCILSLPVSLQPKFLTDVISETVLLDNFIVEEFCMLSYRIEDFIHSEEFLEGILRILIYTNPAITEGFDRTLRKLLHSVHIRRVHGMKTICSYRGLVIDGSEQDKRCFIHKNEDGSAILFDFQVENRDRIIDVIINKDGLIQLIKRLSEPYNVDSRLLTNILNKYEDPAAIKDMLDEENVTDYDIFTSGRLSAFPRPGTYVEEKFHPFLENDIIPFNEQEFKCTAMELEDRMIDNENDDEVDVEPIFIYVRIFKKLDADTDSENKDILLRYLVDTGDISQELVVIPIFRLYRFVRPQEESSVELERFDAQPVRSFTYDENCRRIENMLKDAWTLSKEDRKRIVKRLQLKWHPDRNPNDQEYCKNVFQFIMSVIEDLESETSEYQRMGENLKKRATSYARAYGTNLDAYNRSTNSGPYCHKCQSKHPDHTESKRWLQQAKNDFRAANLGLPDVGSDVPDFGSVDGYNWICYLCHQACEKALKAAGYHIDANSVEIHTHSLSELARTLGNSILTDKVRQLEDRIGQHTRMRYPDSVSRPKIPSDVFGEDEARFSLTTAREVIEIVDEMVV